MAKATYRKTKTGFSYSGDINECIAIAKRKIENANKNTPYITRRYAEEKRRYEAHFKAIENAKDFIAAAEAHIEEQKAKQNTEGGNNNGQ